MILEGGTIHTGDPALPRVMALPIDDRGRVTRGVEAWEGDVSAVSTERIDLEGRTVVPGFVDAHVHFLSWALALDRLDLREARSGQAALDRVSERAAADREAGADGNWLLGSGWTEPLLQEIDDPTAALDAAAGGRPAAVWSRDGHSLWLSRAALAHIGGPAIRREQEAWDAPLPEPSRVERQRAVAAAQRIAHARGITGVHDFERREGRRTWLELDADERVSLRVTSALTATDALGLDAAELVSGFGSDHVRIGPVKALCDGTLGARTAHMLEPYTGTGGLGLPLLAGAALAELIAAAAASGLNVALHAIGDAAVRDALEQLEATRATWGRIADEHPPRIEHAQLIDPADLPRFAKLGVVASMQPVHAIEDRAEAEVAWGERCSGAYAWGPLVRSGAQLVLGSDAPISPLDPLAALAAACAAPLMPGHELDAATALDALTAAPYRITGRGRTLGRLAPGMAADLVVLDGDPLTVAPDAIASIAVVATMVGGRWVHGRPPW